MNVTNRDRMRLVLELVEVLIEMSEVSERMAGRLLTFAERNLNEK